MHSLICRRVSCHLLKQTNTHQGSALHKNIKEEQRVQTKYRRLEKLIHMHDHINDKVHERL